jgi:hypothetical protein
MRNVFLEGLYTDERSETTIFLLKDVRVLEVVLELSGSLDPGVADLANFNGVEFVPFPLVEILIEISNELGMYKVKKSIANITVILG